MVHASSPERRRSLGSLGGEVAAIVLVAIAYRLRWQSLAAFVAEVDHCRIFFCDFVRYFYPMGRSILSTASPVTGFYYPPFAALLFGVLGVLPLKAAEVVWLVVQLLAAAVLLVLPARMFLGQRPGLRFAHALFFAGALPLIHCLKWGQVSLLLTSLTFAALWQIDAGRKVLPAVLLAVAISLKLYPAIVLFYPLLRRDWRLLGMCVAFTFAFSVVLPAAVMGPREAWGFFVAVEHSVNEKVWRNVDSQYVGQVMGRYLHDGGSGGAWYWTALGAGVAAANLGLLHKALRARVSQATLWVWTLCMGSLPFVVKTSWPHYFVFLPAIQAGLGAAMLARGQRVWWWWPAIALLALSVLGSSTVTLIVVGRWQAVSAWGLLFFSNLAALGVAWLVLTERLCRARKEADDGSDPAPVAAPLISVP